MYKNQTKLKLIIALILAFIIIPNLLISNQRDNKDSIDKKNIHEFNILQNLNSWHVSSRIDTKFIVGVRVGPDEIDPQNTYEFAQNSCEYDVIQQVCEGLYGYNYSDPEMAIIPYLATSDGTWSFDGLNYTVPLRSGVTFHDGTVFNAHAVKFTFDRLSYLMNVTGTLPGGMSKSIIASFYEFSDGTPIINRTEVINTYTIKFILNAPYAPLQALLCFSGSYILSPVST
ncbi:MAG: ABC transporter substrate-binding protein, partial [Candidatus Hodarchaeota archaeon]